MSPLNVLVEMTLHRHPYAPTPGGQVAVEADLKNGCTAIFMPTPAGCICQFRVLVLHDTEQSSLCLPQDGCSAFQHVPAICSHHPNYRWMLLFHVGTK